MGGPNICPAVCPTICPDGDLKCPGGFDASGCPMAETCVVPTGNKIEKKAKKCLIDGCVYVGTALKRSRFNHMDFFNPEKLQSAQKI